MTVTLWCRRREVSGDGVRNGSPRKGKQGLAQRGEGCLARPVIPKYHGPAPSLARRRYLHPLAREPIMGAFTYSYDGIGRKLANWALLAYAALAPAAGIAVVYLCR